MVRYSDDGQWLSVRPLRSWARGDLDGPVASSGSGPKPYVKNEVWLLFERSLNCQCVMIVRGDGLLFFLLQDDAGFWSDVTGKGVEILLPIGETDSGRVETAGTIAGKTAEKVLGGGQGRLW